MNSGSFGKYYSRRKEKVVLPSTIKVSKEKANKMALTDIKIRQETEEYQKLLRRCLKLFLILILTIFIGTLGYHLIEGWNFSDCLYMTVITIASVGFEEVGHLSSVGRIFTEILIFIGVTVIAGWVAVATSFFIDVDLKSYFRRRTMIDKISRMRDHTIVCGGGNTGANIIQELTDKDRDVVLIENNPDAVKYMEYKFPKIAIVEANATHEETLWIANIKAAKNLIVSLSCDVDDIYVVITARDLNPNLFIVTRAFNDSTAQRILKVGANEVVLLNKLGGQKMAQMCLSRN